VRLVLTGGDGRLARAAATALAGGHEVRVVDRAFASDLPGGVDARVGDLRDPRFVADAVADRDVVLHLAPLLPPLPADEESALLDVAGRGTYVLLDAALDAGVRRFVVASTLDLFDRLPAGWKVDEQWRPRPEPRVEHLGPWLAELSARESVRTVPEARALCLRFGRIADAAEAGAQPFDGRRLHLDDAVEGVRRAVAFLEAAERPSGWRVFHITAAGPHAKIRLGRAGGDDFGYRPRHDPPGAAATGPAAPASDERPWREVLAPPAPVASRPIRRIVVFGAGGPVAAAATSLLAPRYALRLTDVRPLDEIARENKPQSPGAPLPVPLGPPHENRVVDVRDPDAVMVACAGGMDAVLNATVLRHDPVDAFLVNTLGAYHIVRAAVAHGIRRVVQTGPQQVTMDPRVGYEDDYDVPGNVPARPGRDLYAHSKYLGQEICRVFAEFHDLEIPNLLYTQFLDPDVADYLHPFAVSWNDSARALGRALEVERLPAPYVEMHICADLPHGRFRADRAREVLGWEARDDLQPLWTAPSGA
jgi:nucleoside-diphosphate-sugar epimerase